jgi:hypothetical protein
MASKLSKVAVAAAAVNSDIYFNTNLQSPRVSLPLHGSISSISLRYSFSYKHIPL